MNSRFMEDAQSLETYRLTVSNARVFLYLVSAQRVGLPPTKQQYVEDLGMYRVLIIILWQNTERQDVYAVCADHDSRCLCLGMPCGGFFTRVASTVAGKG